METTEVRVVVRPLKVIASICILISVVLLLVSLSTNYWVESNNRVRHGLWRYCKENAEPTLTNKAWLMVCGVACVVAVVAALIAFVIILFCLLGKQQLAKSAFYVVALVSVFTAMICLLISLAVFPIMAVDEIQKGVFVKKGDESPEWYFSWSYGISWGAWLFLLGAAVLLLIDRTRHNAIRKEKGFYETNL